MPMIRYEIRNEYSLADPELYREADKDDPEALLEGVAMAGLVGVLRQLGDLAEFAAEIFHNLHEEVMATAARGHDLMIRVQQLETELPSIERAFLSQTEHSSFFYHAGVDWHPNLQIDQSLVTRGDLPRFVMDSYEESRAPPRLFLLDKFDVAGAGACLKRYTDPSFFKVETSGMSSADVQREKKVRKAKKKGPRWRNGETPEVLPSAHTTAHTKLHQLFLEERVENGVGNLSHRAKLKRRLNGFPFDSRTGKSYMEKLLKSPSPDHKVLHEVPMNSSSLMLATNGHNESGFEVLEVRSGSPDSESVRRKRSPPSPDREEIMLNPSMYEPRDVSIDDNICEVPGSYPSIAIDGTSSTLDKVTGETVIAVDVENNREGSLTGHQFDYIASEADNYVDAPSAMESEMDTNSGLRVNSDFTSSHMKNQPLISDASEELLHTRSSDSQSTGSSTISDDRNNSPRKEMSSFTSSDSPSTSTETQQSENNPAEGFPSADIPEFETADALSYQETADDDPVNQHLKPVISDDTWTDTDAITNHRSDYEQLHSSLCSNQNIPTSAHCDSGIFKKPESYETPSTSDDEGKKTNLVLDPPCSPSVSDFDLESGDDSRRSSAGELVDEPDGESVPCISPVPNIHRQTTDSSVTISLDLLHEDESDGGNQNRVENIASSLNMFNVLSQNTNGTAEMIYSENIIPGKLDNEFQKLPEDFASDFPYIAYTADNIKSTVSEGEHILDVLNNEDSNVPSDSHLPCIMEDSLGKKLEETSLADAQTVDPEDQHSTSSIDNQMSSETLISSHLTKSPDWLGEGSDAHEGNVNPEEEPTANETIAFGSPTSCEVVGHGTGITGTDSSNNSELLESSYSTPEDLEEHVGTSDTVEKDGISTSLTGREVTEISGSADLKSLNEVHVLLDESHSEADKSTEVDLSSAEHADSDKAMIDNVGLPLGLNKLAEENVHCFEDSGLDELEDDKSCLSGSHGESGLVEKEGQTDVSDAPSLPVDYEAEESIVQEKIGLPSHQLDQELLHSGETSTELSPLLPINHQQMLDHNDNAGDNHSAFTFSFVNYQSPPSVSELPKLRNYVIPVPGYSEDPLGSIFPPSNPFSETNQINLADLPPLPPLPPVQWRMGKLQHASSYTEGEMIKQKEAFPLFISPQTTSADNVASSTPMSSTEDVASSSQTKSTEDVGSSPPPASTDDVNSSLKEMKHSLVQIAPETASQEEKVENSCSSLEAANLTHETIDLPPKIENKQQQQFVMPTSQTEFTSPAEEDGVANGSRTVKLPRPRNPLVDEVAAVDKSKLRKVTERVRPPMQKVDERDSFLEQIRAKSFNLKPAMTSRPSIRGPNTNLNVAAILEKANAIRQALAGSDEDDDDDSWSDS